MLVSSKWKWRMSGKHPSAKDFIILGNEVPLLEGITKWIETSYEKILSKRTNHLTYLSYRFWMKSPEKHYFICGLVKDSCDKIGRSYPMTIIGTGFMKYWEQNLDLIPFSCEKTWLQMESVFASNATIEEFKESLLLIRSPLSDWKNIRLKRFRDVSTHQNFEDGIFTNRNSFVKILPATAQENSSGISESWHSFLKKKQSIPNSVFMGGGTENIMLAAYYKPLDDKDFSSLWFQKK